MLEKKTTENIIDIFESIVNDPENEEFLNKVWVSQESLIKWLESNTIKPKASCQDCRRQMEARIKREAFKIVLEELNISNKRLNEDE